MRHRQGEVSVIELFHHFLCLPYLLQFLLLVGNEVEDFLYEIQTWHSDRFVLSLGLLFLNDGFIAGGLFGSILELAIVRVSIVHSAERLVVSVVLVVGVLPELIISPSVILILMVASVVVLVTPTSIIIIVVVIVSIIIMILVMIIVMTPVIRLVVVRVVIPVISIITFSAVWSFFRMSSLWLIIKKVVNCVQFLLLQIRVKGGLNVFHVFTQRVFG